MENTRTLGTEEVPVVAIDSVKSMTTEMVNGIISDFLEQLRLRGITIDQDGIDTLKEYVESTSKVSMKMSMKVNMDMVHTLEIPIRDANQASIGSF